MRKRLLIPILFLAASFAVRADAPPLSAEDFNKLDRSGYLTPSFEAATRELVEACQAQRDAQAGQEQLKISLPALEQEAAADESKVAALKDELSRYEHPDEVDLAELRKSMKSSSAKLEEQMSLAQAYVWTYPASPHATEAQEDLEQLQKKLADQAQARQDADAARTTAQAKLLQRVHARDLTLEEWRAFLQDKTQNEVVDYLGHPTTATVDYWTYTGTWTTDPVTNQKAGLQLTFNGGRVLGVAPVPVP